MICLHPTRNLAGGKADHSRTQRQFGATEFNPGFGEGRFHPLNETRIDLIDSDANQYGTTRRWAAALRLRSAADGLIWMSRQHDSSEALVLFGDRVERSAFAVSDPPRSLYPPSPAWLDVLRAAESAGITIVFA